MKTKTLKQRLKLYESMLREYNREGAEDGDCCAGFCALLHYKYNIEVYGFSENNTLEGVLPELAKFKPKEYATPQGHWFPTSALAPRIAVLKKVIRLTKKQIEKKYETARN